MCEALPLTLFGGELCWDPEAWTSSDDRVRGGKSQSYLDVSADGTTAHFNGNLDVSTLGGAGFASQRTVDRDSRTWDVSAYAGIKLEFARGDKKRYAFIVKDTLLAPDPETGREQSTVSWECDFELPPQTQPGHAYDSSVFIPWASLTPTYRGRPRPDAKSLDLTGIKRFSIMMRSYFGTQDGDFSLYIEKISALPSVPPPLTDVGPRTHPKPQADAGVDVGQLENGPSGGSKGEPHVRSDRQQSAVRRLYNANLSYVAIAVSLYFIYRLVSVPNR